MEERIVPKTRLDRGALGGSKNQAEANEGKEYIPSTKAFAEFLNLSEEKFGAFKDRLQRAHGHLRIWVHPLYTEQWPGTTCGRLGDASLSDVQDKLRISFFRTTNSVARNLDSSPLVVYEAVKKLEDTRNLIASHLGCEPKGLASSGIIFIPTEAASSELDQTHLVKSLLSGNEHDKAEATKLTDFRKAVDDFIVLSDKQHEEVLTLFPQLEKDFMAPMTENERDSYAKLVIRHGADMKLVRDVYRDARSKSRLKSEEFMLSLYSQIGLKSALVSGAYLEVRENYETKQPQLQACAGSVVNQLRGAHIPTDISGNIWPPKELIKAAGFEVKETGRSS